MAKYKSKLHPQDTPNDVIFPDWTEGNEPNPLIFFNGPLPSGDIISQINSTPGVWWLSSDNSYTGLPDGVDSGIIISIADTTSLTRFYMLVIEYDTSTMYIKSRTGQTGYTQWKTIADLDDIKEMCDDLTQKISACLSRKGVLPSGDIFEMVNKIPGYYNLSSSYSYTNLPLIVKTGLLVVFSNPESSTQTYFLLFDYESHNVFTTHYKLGNPLPWKMISNNKVLANRISDARYEFSMMSAKYVMQLVNSVNNHQSAWNITNITVDNNSILPTGTDILGPIKELGGGDFVGGVHGYEQNVSISVLCNGKEYPSYGYYEVVDVYIHSVLLNRTSLDEVFDRYIHLTFTSNKMNAKVTYIPKKDVVIERATNGGLYAETVDNIAFLSTNTSGIIDLETYNTVEYKNLINATYILNSGERISVTNKYGNQLSTYTAWLNKFSNETPIRFKIYMDIIGEVVGGTPVSAGTPIYGEWDFEVNTWN